MMVAILDSNGLIDNVIIQDFVGHNQVEIKIHTTQWIGDKYSAEKDEQDRINHAISKEKNWRDSELERTGILIQEQDHPYMAEILAYRQRLRDYDHQEGFPFCGRPEPARTTNGKEI